MSNSSVMDTNSSWDPFQQSVMLMTPSGPTTVSIAEIDTFIQYNTQSSIDFGAQIGASVMLLITLLLLSKPDKRRSTIFLVNVLTLVLNTIRTILHAVFFTSSFSEVYAYFAADFTRVSRADYATSITTTVFELLVLISIEVSLCLQVRVICVTLRDAYQRVILGFSTLVALLAVGFRFVYMVQNCIYIIRAEEESVLFWIGSATNITTTVSICWFTLVFLIKLGFAIHQRRKLGMSGFGPMQIIFIMGCQTLIIPGQHFFYLLKVS